MGNDDIKLAQMWADDDKNRDTNSFDSAIKKITDSPNKIFYLIGKSASGKDTIYSALLQELDLDRVLMYTTRPPRDTETQGVEYEFVLKEAFLNMFANHDVAEYRTYYTAHGAWTYFTPIFELDTTHSSKLGIGTIASYMELKHLLGDKLIPIYIEVDNDVRFLRAFRREQYKHNPDYFELCRRYVADEEDFSDAKLEQAGITVRFNNSCENNMADCLNNIITYIKGYMS